MKKLLLLLLLVIPLGLSAQEEKEQPSKSKTIMFQEKGNSLIERKFYEIGAIPGVEFQNIVLKDLETGSKVGSLRLITHVFSMVRKETEEFIGVIDSDELEPCIKALEFMNEIASKGIDRVDGETTEYEYRSRDNVRICLYQSKNNWKLVIQPENYIRRSSCYLKIDVLPDIITNMKAALTQLQNELQ